MRRLVLCSVTAVAVAASAGLVPATAATKPTVYKNCTQLRKTYTHGVGRKGANDRTSGKPVTTWTVNTAVYNANKKSDRDKDGIACEQA